MLTYAHVCSRMLTYAHVCQVIVLGVLGEGDTKRICLALLHVSVGSFGRSLMRLQHALADARYALADAASPTHTELKADSEEAEKASTSAHAAACDEQPAWLQQQKTAGNTEGRGGGQKEKVKARAVVDPMFPVGKLGGVRAYEEAHCGGKEVRVRERLLLPNLRCF
jgi:hypothetical protein